MNNIYETKAKVVKQAEEALKTLKEFSDMQYEAKGKIMIEQIIDYVASTISNVNYRCCGCKYNHLSLSNMNKRFIFYIYDNSIMGSGYPVFSITKDGTVKQIGK